MEDPSSVKGEFFDHFRNRFNIPKGFPTSLNVDMPNPISLAQKEFLEYHCSREEIKKAVWDCGGDRAPGPDGFTFKFITSFWDLLEADVVRFVDEFFHSGKFPKVPNRAFYLIDSKLAHWKARLLSVGGRLSLIKSVLGRVWRSLLTGIMEGYLIPSSLNDPVALGLLRYLISQVCDTTRYMGKCVLRDIIDDSSGGGGGEVLMLFSVCPVTLEGTLDDAVRAYEDLVP
ncbi:hypothetical protein Tco_0172805 [Tanacetum coccineum]